MEKVKKEVRESNKLRKKEAVNKGRKYDNGIPIIPSRDSVREGPGTIRSLLK